MKTIKSTLIVALFLATTHAMATDSVDHSGKASKHSALAVSDGLASTATVASAAAAVPVVVVAGSTLVAASAVVETSDAIADSAKALAVSHKHPHQLVVTEVIITADPAPNDVMQKSDKR